MAVASCMSAWVRRPRRAACERRPAAIVYNYTILLLCDELSRYASVCLWFAPFGSAAITVAVFMLSALYEPHCYHCQDALLPTL